MRLISNTSGGTQAACGGSTKTGSSTGRATMIKRSLTTCERAGGATGLKPSDYRTVPLTASEHDELHNTGERTYWAQIGVDYHEVIVRLLCGYIKDKRAIQDVLIKHALGISTSAAPAAFTRLKLIEALEELAEEERG